MVKQKYESELLGVIYEDALESFRIGAISAERMREYDEACLVRPPSQVSRRTPRSPSRKPALVALVSE